MRYRIELESPHEVSKAEFAELIEKVTKFKVGGIKDYGRSSITLSGELDVRKYVGVGEVLAKYAPFSYTDRDTLTLWEKHHVLLGNKKHHRMEVLKLDGKKFLKTGNRLDEVYHVTVFNDHNKRIWSERLNEPLLDYAKRFDKR